MVAVNRSVIRGVGACVPKRVMTNADMAKLVDTTDEWIVERSGIQSRHIAGDDELTSDLGIAACRQALVRSGIDPLDIDLVICATATPDRTFPATAVRIQAGLGITRGAAFDVQAVCSGFVYALTIADSLLRTGQFRRALVVGAETFSRIVDWSDRATCVLFGDGAGAVVVEAADEPGILSTHLHADGAYENLLHVPGGVSRGFDFESDEGNPRFAQMRGNEVFKMAVNTLGRIVDETLKANDLKKSDVDWLVPHQANIRIINATARKLSMSMDKVVVTVDQHGNTSAASVPLALDVAVRDGRIQRGEVLLLEAFGGGFTWGSVLLKY